MKLRAKKSMLGLAALLSFIFLVIGVPAQAASKDAKRAQARADARETLSILYKAHPSAKRVVEGAAGYAAFNSVGVKIFIAGGGGGTGIAVDNKTKKITYMNMAEVQAGFGIGVKKFRLIWVFETRAALNRFIESGWEFGGQASASAKYEDEGAGLTGAMSVSEDVWLYQLVGDSLAVELTAKGTKYFKDDELN